VMAAGIVVGASSWWLREEIPRLIGTQPRRSATDQDRIDDV
jgi:hypothetical protein